MIKLVHEQVHHIKFGVGTVINQTEDVIDVKFSKEFGNKKFMYPESLETFLILCNPESQEKMNSELRQIREEVESQRKMRKDAEQKVIDDSRKELLQKKRAATKITTAAKSAAKKATKLAKELEDAADEFGDETTSEKNADE